MIGGRRRVRLGKVWSGYTYIQVTGTGVGSIALGNSVEPMLLRSYMCGRLSRFKQSAWCEMLRTSKGSTLWLFNFAIQPELMPLIEVDPEHVRVRFPGVGHDRLIEPQRKLLRE